MGNTPKVRRVAVAPTAAQATSSSWLRYVVGFGVVAAIGLLIWMITSDVAGSSTTTPTTIPNPPAGTVSFDIPEATHTTDPVDYPQDPPAGGNHDPAWLSCGVYEEPVRNENAVHALEHGAVWITYQPALDAGAIDDLERYGRRSEVIVSPYPDLDSPIVLSSWGRQLRLDAVDDAVIDQFYDAFHDRTAPEPNAGC